MASTTTMLLDDVSEPSSTCRWEWIPLPLRFLEWIERRAPDTFERDTVHPPSGSGSHPQPKRGGSIPSCGFCMHLFPPWFGRVEREGGGEGGRSPRPFDEGRSPSIDPFLRLWLTSRVCLCVCEREERGWQRGVHIVATCANRHGRGRRAKERQRRTWRKR